MKRKSILYLGILLMSTLLCFPDKRMILFAEDNTHETNQSLKTEVLYLMKYFYEDERDPQKGTAKIITEGETIGFFSKFEWGDYGHFCIKDLNGKEDSFFISDSLNTDYFYDNFIISKKYNGKKVKVIWYKVDIHIPEAGGNQEIVVMVDFKLL